MTTVAPVAVRAQSWTDIKNPAKEDKSAIIIAHHNIPPALLARFLPAAAGTINIAVTSKTPTAQTEKIIINDKRIEYEYW